MDSNTVTIHFFLFSRRKTIPVRKKATTFLLPHSNSLLPFSDWVLFVEGNILCLI
jgi:hypothetical protein